MFAVIKTGGKQYRVTPGDVIMIEKMSRKGGETVAFDEVLMVSTGKNLVVGQPNVVGAKVEGTVLDDIRGEKVIIFKKRRRHTYRRKRGHRQDLLVVRVEAIHHNGEKLTAAPQKAAAPKKPAAPKAAAAKKTTADAPKAAAKKSAAPKKKADA